MEKYYVIYTRKSVYTGVGESIQNQHDLCLNLLNQKYPQLSVDQILTFEDEGFSGKNTKRPAFQQILSLIKEDKVLVLVAYRLDRISRSVTDFVELLKLLNDHNTKLLLVNDNYDIDSTSGKSMLLIASIFSEMERNIIRERVLDNLTGLSKSARWLGGITPTGYTAIQTQINNKPAKVLQINNNESDTVKLIFDLYTNVYQSLTGVETHLLKASIYTKNGKPHTRVSIKDILSNPVYCSVDEVSVKYFTNLGCQIYNLEENQKQGNINGTHGYMVYKKVNETNTTNQPNNPNVWIVTIGCHEPIVTSDQWIKAQELLKLNTSKSYRQPRNRSNTSLLSSLLYCKCCGSYMRPQRTNRIYKDTGEPAYRYLCEVANKSHKTKCQCVSINGNVMDKIIVEEINKICTPTPDSTTSIIAKLNQIKQNYIPNNDYNTNIKEIEQNIKTLNKEISNLIDRLATIPIDTSINLIIESINQGILDRQTKLNQLKQQVSELHTLASTQNLEVTAIDDLVKSLSNFKQLFEEADVNTKRAIVRSIVQKVEYDYTNKQITIYFVQTNTPIYVDFNKESYYQSLHNVHIDNPTPYNTYYIKHKINNLLILYTHTATDIKYKALYIHNIDLNHTLVSSKNDHDFITAHTANNLNSIGDKLKYYRLKHNLLQTDVARILHIHKATYIKYETNQQTPPDSKLYTIANYYGLDVDELL